MRRTPSSTRHGRAHTTSRRLRRKRATTPQFAHLPSSGSGLCSAAGRMENPTKNRPMRPRCREETRHSPDCSWPPESGGNRVQALKDCLRIPLDGLSQMSSPAGSIFNQPAETVNHLLWRVVHFSTGRMANFQPVLTGRPGLVVRFDLLFAGQSVAPMSTARSSRIKAHCSQSLGRSTSVMQARSTVC